MSSRGTSSLEPNELMQRIFWRHRWLLIVCVLVPVAVVAPLVLAKPSTWAATADVQAQAAAPDADTQALAILSRVTAIATSPAVVQGAIDSARVDRNAVEVARHQISTTLVGSSAVAELTVTDPSQQVAMLLTRSLADAVVGVLNGQGGQSGQQLATLTQQRSLLTASRDDLLKQLAAAQARHELVTSAGVQASITELTAVESQLSANLASEQQIMANSSATVISSPTYATSVSGHVVAYCALAALLGLLVGLLIAAIHDLALPTLAEPAAAARELSVEFLGDVQMKNEEVTSLDEELPIMLDLGARRLEAHTLVLTGPVPPTQLTALAAHLDEHPHAVASSSNGSSPVDNGFAPGIARPGLTAVALPEVTPRRDADDLAIVLVLPRFAPRAALDRVAVIARTTGWPILGVVGLRPPPERGRWAFKSPPPATAEEVGAEKKAATDDANRAKAEAAAST
jgi:hypothetical protein